MTDKERIEDIKERMANAFPITIGGIELLKKDIEFLIDQAERLRELSEKWMKNHDILADEYLQLKEENQKIIETANVIDARNQRYLKALKEILEEAYAEAGVHPDTQMQLDTFIVKTARQALIKEGAYFA